MVANGHVGFWVAGLMIFCIIELHLSLLLTCFEETVAEAKHHVDIRLMEDILHQLIGRLSQYLQGFIHPRWCRISSINSMSTYLD